MSERISVSKTNTRSTCQWYSCKERATYHILDLATGRSAAVCDDHLQDTGTNWRNSPIDIGSRHQGFK